MSSSVATTCPYYSKYDTPALTSRFHKAVFNGRTTKVEQLIAAGENVYVSTDKDENPLFIAIVRDHLTIVNKIIDVYEDDLCFVRNYFRISYHIEWTPQRMVFIAHGTDHTYLVEELSKGMEILPDRRPNVAQGMIVLLKSPSERKVLWLSPNSRDDDIRIAKIVECVWADGVIDLQHTGHWGRTVLDAAAIRCQSETYCRLFPLAQIEPSKIIEHFLLLCRVHGEKLEHFKELYGKIGCQFDIADVILSVPKVLAYPVYHDDQIEIFQYFLECLADKTETKESRQQQMAGLFSTFKAIEPSPLIETIVWADVKEFLKQCLERFQPNLFLVLNNETVLESLIRQKPSEFMTEFIVDHFEEVLANGVEYNIVKRLISQNWLDAIKQLYERYPSTRSVLFRDKSKGVKRLLGAIESCRYNLVNFLIDAHKSELTDPDDVLQLILYCSFVQRSYALLQTLLSLPASDPLRISGPDHYYKSPIYVALTYRHLKNYQLLLDHVSDLGNLRDLREENGENLLFAAIWFKENPVDESPFVYVPEEMASIEIVDSSDDEDEVEGKRVHNDRLFTSSGPIRDPVMPDSFFVEQRAQMNRIFDFLLNELALDPHCVNNSGVTLLHSAVKRDNYHVLKQLLSLGLDVHAKDNDGNAPMHWVCGVTVLNALLEHECDVNATNSAGETPLMVFAKGVVDTEETVQTDDEEEVVAALIRNGADVNHIDANGLTALHLVKSLKVARTLLKHGASINARNAEGETPLLYIFRQQAGSESLYKFFLCHDDLDVKVVSTNNSSALAVIISLNDNSMADVLANFNQRTKSKDLDDLFVQHCNDVDQYDYPVIASSFQEHTNSYCLDKLLSLRELDANVHLGYPLLQLAVFNEHIVRRLIERGANVNGVGNSSRKTPLMYSVEKRQMVNDTSYFNSTQILLSAGADVEIVDDNGDTALNYASQLEDHKLARRTIAALILAKADYYRRSGTNGQLPLLKLEPFQCLYDRECN